jgi:hypothetical protein
MALNGKGKEARFCKFTHVENGRVTTRRIHAMAVQAHTGHLHTLTGGNLPDAINVYSGAPYSGAHAAEVLLNPKRAKGKPLFAEEQGWLRKRDALFIVLGFFFGRMILTLADQVALAMSY